MNTVEKRLVAGPAAERAGQLIETAAWIWHPALPQHQPAVLRFAIDIMSDGSPLLFHLSADQRYTLFFDGILAARGPDCSDPAHWPFATYQVALSPGRHHLLVDVWWIGDHAPMARMTVQGGFILKAEGSYDAQLTTGTAPWRVRHCPEYSFSKWNIHEYQSVGDQCCIRGALRNTQPELSAVTIASAGHKRIHGLYHDRWVLHPSTLPELLSARHTCGRVRALIDAPLRPDMPIATDALRDTRLVVWQNLVDGQAELTLDAHTRLSILCDLEEYYCAYPSIEVSDGRDAVITWSWAEALFEKDLTRKNADRNKIAGLHFTGIEDRFIADGQAEQHYKTHWWRSGRYMLLTFDVGNEPLIIRHLHIEETRYPLENQSHFQCDHPEMDALIGLCFRGMQTNSHDIAADSPYYEQMMYTGDTRIQALVHYVTSRDDRLPRRCIDLFNWSRASGCNGLTTARFPDREHQWIPGFSLMWIWMLHDYFYWRDDSAFVASHLVASRSILNTFTTYLDASGLLLRDVPYWTFVDWTPDWQEGYPPGARSSVSSILNLMYILTLEKAAELEETLGDKYLAGIYRCQRARTASAVMNDFWNEEQGLFADDAGQQYYSEHAQALSLICQAFDPATIARTREALIQCRPKLTRASIYFSFYIFDALTAWPGPDADACFLTRLEDWMRLPRQGFTCPPEVFGECRSDCHAWGSHPLYHLHASVLGVKPASPGFHTVSISPMPLGWECISGITPHPRGDIRTTFTCQHDDLTGEVHLPPETTGTLHWKGRTYPLSSGINTIRTPEHSYSPP